MVKEKIIVKKPKGQYMVGILKNCFCSCQSEFSAFMLFNYQSLITKNKKISNMFKDFSQMHLQNSRFLAKEIVNKKSLPFYTNSQGSPLTALWLQPTSNIKEILLQDKKFILTIINNYEKFLNKIEDKTISKLLKLFITNALKELDILIQLEQEVVQKTNLNKNKV